MVTAYTTVVQDQNQYFDISTAWVYSAILLHVYTCAIATMIEVQNHSTARLSPLYSLTHSAAHHHH